MEETFLQFLCALVKAQVSKETIADVVTDMAEIIHNKEAHAVQSFWFYVQTGIDANHYGEDNAKIAEVIEEFKVDHLASKL